jgi:hypothetical protein
MYISLEYTDIRQLSGTLMLSFGVWYLGFGTRWIAQFAASDQIHRASNSLKPLITGVQVYQAC